MRSSLIIIGILLISLFINQQSYQELFNNQQEISAENQLNEVLYLPNGKALDIISLGYRNALANVIWFYTLNYFGKHYRLDQKYTWLEHMCNLITDLDPKARKVYEFCGLILSWESNNHSAGLKILTKAYNNDPDFWRYYYLKGMTYLLFEKNEGLAKYYFTVGAKKKDAPAFLASLAVQKMLNMDDPEEALKFLEGMINNAPDQQQRDVLLKQYDSTVDKINRNKIDKIIDNYTKKNNRPPKSISELGIPKLKDPFGGYYKIDPQTGKSISSTVKTNNHQENNHGR